MKNTKNDPQTSFNIKISPNEKKLEFPSYDLDNDQCLPGQENQQSTVRTLDINEITDSMQKLTVTPTKKHFQLSERKNPFGLSVNDCQDYKIASPWHSICISRREFEIIEKFLIVLRHPDDLIQTTDSQQPLIAKNSSTNVLYLNNQTVANRVVTDDFNLSNNESYMSGNRCDFNIADTNTSTSKLKDISFACQSDTKHSKTVTIKSDANENDSNCSDHCADTIISSGTCLSSNESDDEISINAKIKFVIYQNNSNESMLACTVSDEATNNNNAASLVSSTSDYLQSNGEMDTGTGSSTNDTSDRKLHKNSIKKNIVFKKKHVSKRWQTKKTILHDNDSHQSKQEQIKLERNDMVSSTTSTQTIYSEIVQIKESNKAESKK
jgi:hypothetical protein